MTAIDCMIVVGIVWGSIAVYVITNKPMETYTEEDMAKAYTMGFDSRSKHMGVVLRKLDEVVALGKRLREGCGDQIACAEFDKLVEEIEQPPRK